MRFRTAVARLSLRVEWLARSASTVGISGPSAYGSTTAPGERTVGVVGIGFSAIPDGSTGGVEGGPEFVNVFADFGAVDETSGGDVGGLE